MGINSCINMIISMLYAQGTHIDVNSPHGMPDTLVIDITLVIGIGGTFPYQ